MGESSTHPVLVFKHSLTCGTSAQALDELADHLEHADGPHAHYALVTVQTHRDVSTAISARLGIRHETPQALLIMDPRGLERLALPASPPSRSRKPSRRRRPICGGPRNLTMDPDRLSQVSTPCDARAMQCWPLGEAESMLVGPRRSLASLQRFRAIALATSRPSNSPSRDSSTSNEPTSS